jgi:hypothetical protein
MNRLPEKGIFENESESRQFQCGGSWRRIGWLHRRNRIGS